MGLPVQKVPEYFCELPLSGLKVKFRPFLVGEQKTLLLMQESEEQALIFDAVQTLVKEVTFGEISDAGKLPMADLEYLFLQIRMKSIGESTKLNLICTQEECEATNPLELDLNDVKIDTSNIPDKEVELSEELGVIMKFPTADLQKYADEDENDAFINILKSSIDTIYDAEDTYDTKDYADREMDEFLNSLSLQQVEKMGEFLNDTPTLSHVLKYTCVKCKSKNSVMLKGLENFF
tara:strand:+ start:315 stop:1019 length:705 start_codon:yes stop_codon:yes gene_type:complete